MNSEERYEANKRKLIVALDVSTASEAVAAVKELRNEVGAFKVGLQLFTSEGPSLVRQINELGARTFLDVKYHDIPNTVARAAVEAARLGIWMFNVHAAGGSEMMRAAAESVAEVCDRESLPVPKMIAVTVLTSSDAAVLKETGIHQDVEVRVLQLARLAAECGLQGVVASPKESGLIKDSLKRPDFEVITPGIRPAESVSGDQKRVMTPARAVAAGSDYLVVGRPIMTAADRALAARQIIKDMTGAFEPPIS